MAKLIFIEGISGVGKSTMVQTLQKELTGLGYKVRSYLEGDYTNPIDFYGTAYFTTHEYEKLCSKYYYNRKNINMHTIKADDIRLIRYANCKKYIFEEPLLSVLIENEFCYHPKKILPMDKFVSIYKEIWNNYQNSLTDEFDFIIFDGSLLHHPLNDIINNYNITAEQAVPFITALTDTLKTTQKYIFYLKTDNIKNQLQIAYKERNRNNPTEEQIDFWERRFKDDMVVFNSFNIEYEILNITNNGWNKAKEEILSHIQHFLI